MFGSGGGSKPAPTPPSYVAPPAYTQAPPYQQPDLSANSAFQQSVPQVENGSQVLANSPMGPGEQNALQNGWMNLSQNPTDATNVAKATNYYKQLQQPGVAQMASDLNASGQGGSSYAAQAIGQQNGMNDLQGFTAGIQQQQADFQNQLAGRNALYSGPIALEQQQNQANVARGLGVGQMAQQNSNAYNSYGLANNQGFNNYNMQGNQGRNQFGLGVYNGQNQNYATQTQAATARNGQNLSFMGGIANTLVGSQGII